MNYGYRGFLTQIFSKARLFEASERCSHISLVVGVDENGACIQPFTNVQSFADVSCEDA